jgi:release factor glutamine methyltransferase
LENAERLGVRNRAKVIQGDALEFDLPDCDLLVSNPPYVPTRVIDVLQPEVRDHDPRAALDGGEDGLEFIRGMMASAAKALRPGGWIALEHGDDQGESVPAILREVGFADVRDELDLAGRPRVAVGCRS